MNKCHAQPFTGFIETVPAYNSLAIFYDGRTVRQHYTLTNTAHEFVENFTKSLLSALQPVQNDDAAPKEIPVYYNGEDLEHIAATHQLTTDEIIRIHSENPVKVFMIGFLPGFAYMGKVDKRIATPRRSIPRLNVKAGSVGIAGIQTGIYPLDSPGGWQIVGQTPFRIFDTSKSNPCMFAAGDTVRFKAIDKITFDELNEY